MGTVIGVLLLWYWAMGTVIGVLLLGIGNGNGYCMGINIRDRYWR